MSKKTKFWSIFALNLLLLIVSALLNYSAGIGFAFSTIWWWDKEHALKKDGVTIRRNPLKRKFAAFNRLDAYYSTVTVLYYIALSCGLFGLAVELLSTI